MEGEAAMMRPGWVRRGGRLLPLTGSATDTGAESDTATSEGDNGGSRGPNIDLRTCAAEARRLYELAIKRFPKEIR